MDDLRRRIDEGYRTKDWDSALHTEVNGLALRARDGDRAALEQLLVGYATTLQNIADNSVCHVERDDLYQWAAVAFTYLISEWDASQLPFGRFLPAFLKHRLMDVISSDEKQHLHMSRQTCTRRAKRGNLLRVYVRDTSTLFACRSVTYISGCDDIDNKDVIEYLLSNLDPMHRKALELRYWGDGHADGARSGAALSLSEIGRHLGVTEGRASQLCKEAIGSLREIVEKQNRRDALMRSSPAHRHCLGYNPAKTI